MRPKKTRWVKCVPGERCFKPRCKPLSKLKDVYLALDEFEAIRLADLCELKQIDAAKLMHISRPTFSRIVASARKKVTDGLVNIKVIRIEGGCCKIKRRSK
ncbi:MAG: DUF134 domain-containing protein [Candidatus Omnitrophica bacterium]|nr:DUF134 domain-containing protein [Candidatus Omnitrophota bacterium]MDO9573013.1 DUF134 domain-containing protein [Candidatus Omnitrophota bacterium]